MTLIQNATQVGRFGKTIVAPVGGTGPYTFSVVLGGAGGSVDIYGVYTAAGTIGEDVIKCVDSLLAEATATISVSSPAQLVCDIIRSELGLADDQVMLWNQKFNIPNDSRLYVVVAELNPKPFGSSIKLQSDGTSVQSINMKTLLSIDIKSRGPDARDRKEEVVMALKSLYAEQQQEANGFQVASIPMSIVDLSNEDGAAIPYRFNITTNLQYSVTKVKAVPYFDEFSTLEVTSES